MSQARELQAALRGEIARVRRDVLPFWAGTLVHANIGEDIERAVRAIIGGSPDEMLVAFARLRRLASPIAVEKITKEVRP
jgi:hypothetical protein